MNNIHFEKPPFFYGKSPFIQIIFLLLFTVGGAFIFSALGQLLSTWIWGDELYTMPVGYLRLVSILSAIGTFLVPALLFSYCSDNRWLSFSKADHLPGGKMAIGVIILSIVIIPIVGFLAYYNELIRLPEIFSNLEAWMKAMEESAAGTLEILTADRTIPGLLISLVVMALLPAIAEEFFFRGTIQPLLQKWIKNSHAAIWITAFIFSAIHLQFYGFIPRFLLGAYLGYLFVWSGSIWLPALAHFMHNAISVTGDFILTRNNIEMEDITPMDIPGYFLVVIICIFIFIPGIYYLHKNAKN